MELVELPLDKNYFTVSQWTKEVGVHCLRWKTHFYNLCPLHLIHSLIYLSIQYLVKKTAKSCLLWKVLTVMRDFIIP